MGHCPVDWTALFWAWGWCSRCLALDAPLLFVREFELDRGLHSLDDWDLVPHGCSLGFPHWLEVPCRQQKAPCGLTAPGPLPATAVACL